MVEVKAAKLERRVWRSPVVYGTVLSNRSGLTVAVKIGLTIAPPLVELKIVNDSRSKTPPWVRVTGSHQIRDRSSDDAAARLL